MVTVGYFLLFYLPPPPPPPSLLKTPKIKILKNEKICWRYHHFTHHFIKVYPKSQSHDVWFMIYRVDRQNFFVILGHFLSFYHLSAPLMIPKDENFEKKIKKMSGHIILLIDFIILHKCTTNYDQLMYGS